MFKLFNRYADPARPVSWRFFLHVWASVILLVLSSACSVGPDFKRPETAMPTQWSGTAQGAATAARAIADEELACWWTVFGDPMLSSLVERATAANLDLKLAEARVRQARAARAVAAGGLGPAVDGSGVYQRSQSSLPAANGQTTAVSTDQYQAGFDAGWEIDLFGGQRRNREAAEADLKAVIESRRDVLVSLISHRTASGTLSMLLSNSSGNFLRSGGLPFTYSRTSLLILWLRRLTAFCMKSSTSRART